MSSKEFYKVADAALKDAISEAGFKRKSPGIWNRQVGDELNALCLQRYRGEEQYCVNLGVHYSFLPTPGTGKLITGSFRESDCEIRMRLTSHDSTKDQWWLATEESATEIARLSVERALPIFDSYRLDGPISTTNAREFGAEPPKLLSMMTKVRGLLLLARIHEHLGNRDQAIQAAARGLEVAEPHATLVIASLKDTLHRLSNPHQR